MKPLSPNSVFVRPFKAYKGFSYTYNYLNGSYLDGISSSMMTVEEAVAPPANWTWSGSMGPINPETGRYKRVVYASIENMFYPSSSIDSDLANTSRRLPEFEKGWNLGQTGEVYVISLSQQTYGERIRPGSVSIIGTGGSILDTNGLGKLYSSISPNNVVGNIFYEKGIVVICKSGSVDGINNNGMYLTAGSEINVSYESQLTIYENTIICTLERDEFNYSSNPSLSLFLSGSCIGGATSSISGSTKMFDAMAEGSLTPYITTIGLYNNARELVAIAKVPRAIRRTPEIDQSFICRFDS